MVTDDACRVIVEAGLPHPGWVARAVTAGEDPHWELGSGELRALTGLSFRQVDYLCTVGLLATVDGDPSPGPGRYRRFTPLTGLRVRAARIAAETVGARGGVPEMLRLIPAGVPPGELVSAGFVVSVPVDLSAGV